MADDARISTALPKHFKTMKLKRRLGAPGCWSLVCLFLWVADNKPSGDLAGMTDEEIEIIGQWEGAVGGFVNELVAVRFLDGIADARTVHDWQEHNPWAFYRPQRVENAKKAIAIRWGKNQVEPKPNTGSNTGRIQGVIPTSPHHTSPPDTTKSKSVGARPTLEQVRAYCKERNNGVDPQKWFDHYQANGWKVGRTPMKDWQAAVRTWERNGIDNGRPEPTAPVSVVSQPEADAVCRTCAGEKMIHQMAHIPGPRLVPCPDCVPAAASRSGEPDRNQLPQTPEGLST
jgi:hypothetical protein